MAELLTPLVFLNHEQTGWLQALVGGEARATLQALAPAAYAVIYLPGVYNLRIMITTIRAVHNKILHYIV